MIKQCIQTGKKNCVKEIYEMGDSILNYYILLNFFGALSSSTLEPLYPGNDYSLLLALIY